jgi:hypothetical protein
MWKLGLRPSSPFLRIHKWDFRCSVDEIKLLTYTGEVDPFFSEEINGLDEPLAYIVKLALSRVKKHIDEMKA